MTEITSGKCSKCECLISVKVREFSKKKFGEPLCWPCQCEKRGVPVEEKIVDSKEKDTDIVSIKGKDFITYAGLLKRAHEAGLLSMEITWREVNFELQSAACIVRASFPAGKVFDGFGSATPENSGSMVKDHYVELCQTRAKARALRDALNIGTVAEEELKK